MKKKIQIKFFVCEKIASEFVALICLYQEESTCHRQSVSYETVLRFCISLTETFGKIIDFAVINKSGKLVVLQI